MFFWHVVIDAQELVFESNVLGHTAGVAELDGNVYVATNQQQKGDNERVGVIHKLDLRGDSKGNVASLEKGEVFAIGLYPFNRGFVGTVTKTSSSSICVFESNKLRQVWNTESSEPLSDDYCLLVAPESGNIVVSDRYGPAPFLAVMNKKGQLAHRTSFNSSAIIQSCPVMSDDESTLYYAIEDEPAEKGTIQKISMTDGNVQAVSSTFFDLTYTGPALDHRGSVYISSFRSTAVMEYYFAQYDDETLDFQMKIILPSSEEDYISDIANPMVSPDGSIIYMFGHALLVAIQAADPNDVVFKVAMEGYGPPLLTSNGKFLVFYTAAEKGGVDVLFVDAATGEILKTVTFDDADNKQEPILQNGKDHVYLAYTQMENTEIASKIVAFRTSMGTTVNVPKHRKETWMQFLLEFLLYFLILVLSLAYQLWRMFRSGSPSVAESNGYAPVTSKEDTVEMTELKESALNAEYGEVDEDEGDETLHH
jgi:hypothetical protein